jgi:hypothetical protein
MLPAWRWVELSGLLNRVKVWSVLAMMRRGMKSRNIFLADVVYGLFQLGHPVTILVVGDSLESVAMFHFV